ncbi:MAG: MarR family transcriptional regulator [Firmicutes bacterium]|nr:MarR family transcriptional regulator [Bacillota bacterium]
MIFLTYHYGHLLRVLTSCTETTMNNALASMDLTAAQGHIMGYLAQRSQPPCSRDIEEAFHLSHPTVSGLLSRLEKKGFIVLRPDEEDRRCKRIYVLPKGEELHETMHRTIAENEARMVENFTPEERAQFVSLLLRAISNMGATNYIRKFKEESDE